jgi:hypothetical protein
MQRFAAKPNLQTQTPKRSDLAKYAGARSSMERSSKSGGQGRSALLERFSSIPLRTAEKREVADGAPLEGGVRARYEAGLGRSLADVRVHTDGQAAEAARSMNADAYTVGRDVVFGEGRYRPGTPAGERLLAHELAHVVQQGGSSRSGVEREMSRPGDAGELAADRAADSLVAGRKAGVAPEPVGIQRQEAGKTQQTTPTVTDRDKANDLSKVKVGDVGPGAEDIVLIRDWMEKHQFAQPENQQTEGEKHVLLNGEEMTISAAVKLAVDELKKPEELIRTTMMAQLSPPAPVSFGAATFVGPGNRVPGLKLMPETWEDNLAIRKANELTQVDEWLEKHGYTAPEVRDPTGDKVVVDGQDTTVEQVADRVLQSLGPYPALKRAEVLTHLRQKYVVSRGGHTTQVVFGYTLTPKSFQATTAPGSPTTQHQFSFQITRQHHENDDSGFETSFQGSVTFDNNWNILNVQGTAQEAIVKPLLRGWVQISGLVQLTAAENWNRSYSGAATSTWGVQAAAGGQILVTPNFRSGPLQFLNGHLQVGVQVLGTAGVSGSTSGVTFGGTGGAVINIPFSFGGG